jgi:hypothetical protein
MLHALRSDIYDGSHDDVEECPSNELFCVQVRTGGEVVFHMLETRKDGSEDVLDAKTSGPRLYGEPD